ncbi:MAG TPA: response regulator [Gemmataceae bacterium]|jgi:CheY-like chemotaxis protein|nr:response regulator [Gemmataceae bacterium]
MEADDILVIEDDGDARWALKALLESAGYRVACAAHGGEALAYLRQGQPPRVILLDLSMPIMDGWAFRKQQQRVAAWSVIPVVLLSAEEDLAWQAAALGTAAYLHKPVEVEQLLATLRSLGQPPSLRAG